LLLTPKKIAEAPPTTSKPKQEEDFVPPVIDPAWLSLVHQSVTQKQATLGDLPMKTVEMKFAPSVQIASEQGESQPEPETESSLILPTLSASSSTDLVVAPESVRQ